MSTTYISRSGNKTFRYYDHEGSPVQDKQAITYYKSLKIPPAWQEVKISSNVNAKVLVTGIDGAGRKQYIYNPVFRARQEAAKFDKILRFARALPQMRTVVAKDLKRPTLDYRKVMATIISIMDRTNIRVGNDTYAKTNNSYGLTTLRGKHTAVEGDTITFDFIGKSGKHHIKKVADRSLARIVKQLDDLPGYEVFKYYGDDKKLHDVKSTDVNQYIKDVMGEEYSAKDFRTWAGTLMASVELVLTEREMEASSERERKKVVTACVRKVAKKLGNTPAVARSSYIDPRIVQLYMSGKDVSKVRSTVSAMQHKAGPERLSPEENCVLRILEKPTK